MSWDTTPFQAKKQGRKILLLMIRLKLSGRKLGMRVKLEVEGSEVEVAVAVGPRDTLPLRRVPTRVPGRRRLVVPVGRGIAEKKVTIHHII